MLHEFFNSIDNVTIHEKLNHLRISTKDIGDLREVVYKYFDVLKTISSRDTYEVFFDIDGSAMSICDASKSSYDRLIKHIHDYYEDDSSYEIELKIEKIVADKKISVYFLDEFSDYISNESPLNILTTLSKIFDEKIYFEVFSTIQPFYSHSMIFYQKDYFPESFKVAPSEVREKQLEMFLENCNFTSLDLKFIPDDFNLIKRPDEHSEIGNFFYEMASVLSIIFISNSSEINKNGGLTYKINGYKMILCEDAKFSTIRVFEELPHKIYAWAYEGGNKVDKLGLVRNVLSIHLDDNNKIRFDNEAWDAIKSNYQVYLKDNLQSYLEIKNKIGEFIIDSTAKTYGIADQLLESLKNNIFVLLTFLLTVVLVNGLKDNGYNTVFSDGYFYIVIILTLVSIVWLAMTLVETNNRFESASSTIKDILKLNYQKVIMESEIEEVVEPVISKNRIYLRSQLKRYGIWWLSLLVVFCGSFTIANQMFEEENLDEQVQVKTESEAEIKVDLKLNEQHQSRENDSESKKQLIPPIEQNEIKH